MRDRLQAELGSVRYSGFLCYLMGPYSTFDVEALDQELRGTNDRYAIETECDDSVDEMLALLRRLQGRLRTDPGVNAFLAIDAGIPLEAMDAATQSIEFARASNAVAFVVPHPGDNLSVGLEVGGVLEDQYPESDRLLVVHEKVVTSAMLDAVSDRWDARLATYADEADLAEQLRRFVAEIMYRESTGRLPRKDR